MSEAQPNGQARLDAARRHQDTGPDALRSIPSELIDDRKDEGVFRVHRSAMTSETIRELELRRVFDQCWLYLGHDSEIPEPGDYKRRTVAGRQIIFVRSKDSEIRAFHNTCPHRGAIVCRQREGNASSFQCFYHAWTFDNAGRLTGMPGPDAYEGGGFSKEERGLMPVARLEHYRGLYFLSFKPDIMSLVDYLAEATEFLDLIFDQSSDGQMKISPGTHEYSMRANWKLLAENSVDGYHGMPTHQTYFAYVTQAGGLGGGGKGLHGRTYSLGNGHAVLEYWSPWGRPVARWVPMMGEENKDAIEATRARLEEVHGVDRANRVAEWNRNMIIYPNLVINDIMATTLRTFYPVSADHMEISAWSMAPAEEEGARLQTRLHNFLEFLGPGGFATPDDVEALESCQIGFNAGGQMYNDVSRGMLREASFDDELQMRAFWRQWAAQIDGRVIDDWSDGPSTQPPLPSEAPQRAGVA